MMHLLLPPHQTSLQSPTPCREILQAWTHLGFTYITLEFLYWSSLQLASALCPSFTRTCVCLHVCGSGLFSKPLSITDVNGFMNSVIL